MRALAAIVLATTSLLGCDVGEEDGIDPIQESQDEIIGGATDYGDPAVGLIRFVKSVDAAGNVTNLNVCTGTLVAPNIMVTAAHCATGTLWQDVTFATQPNMFAKLGAAGYTGGQIIASPLYNPNVLGHHDIAVFLLSGYLGTPVAKRGPTPAVGSFVRAIGYGASNFNQTGIGLKRHISLQVNNIEARVFGAGYEGHNVCHGDSGGPVVQNGRIVGVNNYVDTADCHGGGHFARLDDNLPFLRTYLPSF